MNNRYRLTRFFSGIGHNTARTLLLTLLPAVLLVGCYAFVGDDEPPEWTPDPKDVALQAEQGAAGASGGPGAVVFNQKCAVCHQMTGKGIPAVYPPLVGSAIVNGDPALPIKIVLHGFQGPITREGQNYNGVMQPWQNELSDQQIADVLTFVRSSWGNASPAVDAAAVKAARDATKDKVGAFTESELKSSK